MKKIMVQGNYQYSEANVKEAMALRSFGWLIGRRSEHENKKGEKVLTIRRDMEFANDGLLKSAERDYKKYCGRAQKVMTSRHRWGQFFAILFTVVGIVLGTLVLLNNLMGITIPVVSDFVSKDALGDMIGKDMGAMAADYGAFVLLAIGVISLISVFVNNGRYKKRMVTPKRKYAKKYESIYRSSLKVGAERVLAIKADKRYLMTRNDKKLFDLGETFQRAMDRNADEFE